ncbi:hypothetical protein ACWEQJ_35580 [Streptomyces cyaneofuscatus]
MHATPAAKDLLAGKFGERISVGHAEVTVDENGKYQMETSQSRSVNKYLPQVQVRVCKTCNEGWMGTLEEEAKRILSPLILEGQENLDLDAEDLTLLSAWVTKTWMAYALTRSPLNNPFTEAEYHSLASEHRPPHSDIILLMHSVEPITQVAIGIFSSYYGTAPPTASDADNGGLFYFAVKNVALLMFRCPPELEEFRSILLQSLTESPNVQRAWPSPESCTFPSGFLSEEALATFLRDYVETQQAITLPYEGLSPDEAQRAMEEFLNGDSPNSTKGRFPSDPATE